MLSSLFRRRLFLHQDGFVLGMILGALETGGVLPLLLQADAISAGAIAERTGARRGHLHVALRCLSQQGWLERDGPLANDELAFRLTAQGRAAAAAFPLYCGVASALRADGRLLDERGALAAWIDVAERGWRVPSRADPVDEQTQRHLDGLLAVPVMLSLSRKAPSGSPPAPGDLETDVLRFLRHLGWVDASGAAWTQDGRAAFARVLLYGMVGSYAPMFLKLPALLFGEERLGEWRVDRRLNVLASAAAHQRYFSDTDDIFLDLFDRDPIESQPDFVADMGCGDGSWLAHIYELVSQRTRRGHELSRAPLLMVGVDSSATAREVTTERLRAAAIPSLVIAGDIGDPAQLGEQLQARGLDIHRGLHIRAFIDHDRRHQTGDAGLPSPTRPSTGAFVDDAGQPIANRLVELDLIASLANWTPYIRRHGIVILEAHSVDPEVAARNLGELHSLAFDAYHGFSLQYPLDFGAFMDAAAISGLEASPLRRTRYPSNRPFVSVGSHHFLPRTAWPFAGASEDVPRRDGWRPDGTEDLEDGEALHRLLYQAGDLERPKAWADDGAAKLLTGAVDHLRQLIKDIGAGHRPPAIAVADYGAGTGFAVIELLKICQREGLLQQIHELDIDFTIHLLDLPSGWFAKGYELLKTCPFVRFASLRSAGDGRFRPLAEIFGTARLDLVTANMVFHLIPPRALDRLAVELAGVLKGDGRLLWTSPDLGPAPHDAALFHEPNRRLRARLLQVLDDPSSLPALLDRARAPLCAGSADLAQRMAEISQALGPAERARAAAMAERQILPQANAASRVEEALLAASFQGEMSTRCFEMPAEDSLAAILTPANQRMLAEIADVDVRRRFIELVMIQDVLPGLSNGPAGTAYGFSMQWTFGDHRPGRMRSPAEAE